MNTTHLKVKIARLIGDSPLGMDDAVQWAIDGIRENGRRIGRWNPNAFSARLADGVAGVVIENESVGYCAQIAVKRGVAKVVSFFDTDRLREDALTADEVTAHVLVD